jgi:hypothetical protein
MMRNNVHADTGVEHLWSFDILKVGWDYFFVPITTLSLSTFVGKSNWRRSGLYRA